jgi:hypothetical protein
MPHVLTIMTLCSRALTTFWKRKMIVILSSRAFMKVVQLNNGPGAAPSLLFSGQL